KRIWWMPSGSLMTKTRPQGKRRSTTNSSNNSSSQTATALSGKVRISCQVESGRLGRGGIARAGCGSGDAVIAARAISDISRLDRHLDPAAGVQIGPGERLDLLSRRQPEAEALRQYRQSNGVLDQRHRGADADMRPDSEGQVGVARAAGDLVRGKPSGIKAVRLPPQCPVPVHQPGK